MKKESFSLRLLYGTPIGRAALLILTRPFFSKAAGIFLDSAPSRVLVPFFIRKHNIELAGLEKKKFYSFNDFFTRKRCENPVDEAADHMISPCDGYLSVYPISESQVFQMKQIEYRLDQLLGSRKLARRYEGGTCLIFRLTPQNYHRYCYVCSGRRSKSRRVDGRLHCVRPIAYTSVPVFAQNSREYLAIRTQEFGTMIQMEIGALLVGRICNFPAKETVRKGEEKGYFEFGGSTIVVLVQKGRLKIKQEIARHMAQGLETSVRLGEWIGDLR